MGAGHANAAAGSRRQWGSPAALAALSAALVAAAGTAALPPDAHAAPSVGIIMEKTTYGYCERLFYTIQVSEVTEQFAVIHITDESGSGSSAVPIRIVGTSTPVPSNIAFNEDIFPLGRYTVDVEYAGQVAAAEFTLVDSGKRCIPELMKPIVGNWLAGNIIDGFLVSAFQRYVDAQLVDIPFEIDEGNIYGIDVPDWVETVGLWWLEGTVSDEGLANVVNYLVDRGVISAPPSPTAAGAAPGT